MKILSFAAVALLVSCTTVSTLAQDGSSTISITGRNGAITVDRTHNNGQFTVDKSFTGAYGKTALVHKTIDADASDGTLSRTRSVMGPEGLSRTESGNASFNNGILSTSKTVVGRGGFTKTRQAVRSPGSVSVSRTGRTGRVYSRSRR